MGEKRNSGRLNRIDDPHWRKEEKLLQECKRRAPYIKKLMRNRGCDLPFYDLLDSYPEEFRRIVEWAKLEYPSLLSVLEVEDTVFARPQDHWDELGCGKLTQVFFGDNNLADYESGVTKARYAGVMAGLHDENKNLRTIVLIRRSVKGIYYHRELKYILKIVSLCHELGHVHDAERGINLKVGCGPVDLIEAEVFANLFALDLLAKRGLRSSFNVLANNFKSGVSQPGSFGEISKAVVAKMPVCSLPDWNTFSHGTLTEEEAELLGPKGIAILTN